MPTLEIKTNVKVANAKELIADFAKVGAEVLGKPLGYICTSYTYNETLTFGGTFEPAFILTINSLGNINPDANLKYSKSFFAYFEKKLGVPHDRGYITFTDPGNVNMGHASTHFGEIFGKN